MLLASRNDRAHRKVGSVIRDLRPGSQEGQGQEQLDHHGVDDVDEEGTDHGHHQEGQVGGAKALGDGLHVGNGSGGCLLYTSRCV